MHNPKLRGMLATVGWIATDLGMRFPGDQFQSVQTTLEANSCVVFRNPVAQWCPFFLFLERVPF